MKGLQKYLYFLKHYSFTSYIRVCFQRCCLRQRTFRNLLCFFCQNVAQGHIVEDPK